MVSEDGKTTNFLVAMEIYKGKDRPGGATDGGGDSVSSDRFDASPASRHTSTRRVASFTSVSPHARKNSFPHRMSCA